jgi:hypothetical protein
MGVRAITYLLEVRDEHFEGESNEERAHELLRRAIGLGRPVQRLGCRRRDCGSKGERRLFEEIRGESRWRGQREKG